MTSFERQSRFPVPAKLLALTTTIALGASACGAVDNVRSDIQPAGMDFVVEYDIEASPNGGSEVNQTTTYGPFSRILDTTFSQGAGIKTQESVIINSDGEPIEALSMIKPSQGVGVTRYLENETARYHMRDASGDEACGIKIRQQFRRDAGQALSIGRGTQREKVDFDALWYYTVPCSDSENRTEIEQDAELYALVINEQWTPRVTGDPLYINRGHSVTIVGEGPASELQPGWWDYTDVTARDDVKDAAEVVRRAVHELDNPNNQWLDFGDGSVFSNSEVIYSAGDAEVYGIERLLLNRQTDYVVNYRTPDPDSPTGYSEMKSIIVRPVYNFEWNDWDDQYEGWKSQLDGLLNDQGQPDKPSSAELREIERSGCQNCPNPTLEQIQFIDTETGDIKYAMTLRAFSGANDTLFMLGPVKPPSTPDEAREQAGVEEKETVIDSQCKAQIKSDKENDLIAESDVITLEECAEILREGILWDYLTNDADTYGFDVVGHYRVEDNSTWAPIPCNSDGGTCGYRPIERHFNASYKFNNGDVEEPLAVLNLLGEVGVRVLGITYASGKQQGSGILYALEQKAVQNTYNDGVTPESPFMLDSRADQLPQTIALADTVLFGSEG